MQSFEVMSLPDIVFGSGRLGELGGRLKALAGESAPVLLLADPSLAALGISARALHALTEAGHRPRIFDSFAGEPNTALIDSASAMAHDMGARAIVGLGGGTVLDTAKLAAACAVSGASAETYALCNSPLPAEPLPLIAIPTTAGTGSEVTSTSVFSTSGKLKLWAWGKALKPRLALLDPELTLAVPTAVTAATALDALVHAIEASTNRNRNELADLFCHRAIALIAGNLSKVLADGRNLEARAALLLGSCLAGIGIDNCGTALAHNISHALAALAPIAHGRATALAMLATMDWVAEAAPRSFAAVAEAMGEKPQASAAVARFGQLLRDSGIKISLEGEGLDLRRPDLLARQMAKPENAPMRHATVRHIDDADLVMLAERLYGLR